MEKYFDKINKLLFFFIIYSIVFITFFCTIGYTLPFVLAIIFALLLKGPTKYLIDRFKFKNSIASLITTSILFTIIIVFLFLMVTFLASEISQLTVSISTYAASKTDVFYGIFDKLQRYFNDLDPNTLNTIKNSIASSVSAITKSTANIGMLVVAALLGLASSVPYVLMVIVFTLIATYFFTKDISKAENKIIDTISNHDTGRIFYIFSEARRMLFNYMKSFLFIIFITFVVTFIGFLFARVEYALVLSILCAIFDLLPVLGIAIIYFPIAILFLINGKFISAGLIIALYALVSVIRQIVEPKIMSSSLGLHPVAVLAAIFIGLKANGVAGMFFCMFLVVFYNIFKKVNVL